jgi:hypothetical protein
MASDDPLLLRLWRMILVDTGKHFETGDEIVGKPAREELVKSLLHEKMCLVKGERVSLGKWFSFNKAHDSWDKNLGKRALLIGSMAIDKGWCTAAEDLFDPPRKKRRLIDGANKEISKAKAYESAKARLESIKSKCANHLHAAAQLLCDPDFSQGVRILALGTRAEYTSFSEARKMLKGVEPTRKFMQAQSQSAWLKTALATFRCHENLFELSRAGFRVEFPKTFIDKLTIHSGDVAYQDSLAVTLGTLTEQVVKYRLGSCLWNSDYWPGRLAGLLATETRAATLAAFKRDVAAYHAAKEYFLSLSKLLHAPLYDGVSIRFRVMCIQRRRSCFKS